MTAMSARLALVAIGVAWLAGEPAAPRARAEPIDSGPQRSKDRNHLAATVSARALPDYRSFRALSIDLVGRPPSRAEIAAFEQPGFDLDAWLDARLTGPLYAERIRRIYTDLLRLELTEGA